MPGLDAAAKVWAGARAALGLVGVIAVSVVLGVGCGQVRGTPRPPAPGAVRGPGLVAVAVGRGHFYRCALLLGAMSSTPRPVRERARRS